jgi:tyrosyl-tRNA synthetase
MTGIRLLDELAWRGLLHQHTEGAPAALAGGPLTAYAGFDPTASSLHVGNLVPVMLLVHLQRAGHRPIALAGGGTGLIGDPSGRKSERELMTPDMVEAHTRAISGQLERFLDFSGVRGAAVCNNADWLVHLRAIEFMRDVGKHFTVNYMTAKESVKARLEDGISFTEFSYMLLQAYDFLELHRREGVTMQVGGSDQWGNITAGIELIRRTLGADAHGITAPLVTTASGAKFGKSEGNAVWLDPTLTSPYKFYQYWVNADDRDVGKYLRMFSLLERAEIEALESAVAARPESREAQQALARDMTTRLHGGDATRAAVDAARVLFDKKADPRALGAEALAMLASEIPFAEQPAAGDPPALDVLDTVVALGFATSKGEARRLLQQGGLSVNGQRVSPDGARVAATDALHGSYFLIRKGARDAGLVRLTRSP